MYIRCLFRPSSLLVVTWSNLDLGTFRVYHIIRSFNSIVLFKLFGQNCILEQANDLGYYKWCTEMNVYFLILIIRFFFKMNMYFLILIIKFFKCDFKAIGWLIHDALLQGDFLMHPMYLNRMHPMETYIRTHLFLEMYLQIGIYLWSVRLFWRCIFEWTFIC